MTDAPERIRVAQDADGFWTCREAVSGSQEYVRADLYAALEAKLAEARQAVALFEDYGCPVCHGDCASANPPVQFCPMEIARRVREGGKSDG